MAMIKPLKLTPKKLSSLTTRAIILITLAILAGLSLFLYKNFYETITQAKKIIILREKVALDTIDMEKFNVIMDKLAKKISPYKPENVINPFR